MLQTVHIETEGRKLAILKERITIGSVPSADVQLMSKGISPLHAVIEINNETGKARVFDLASDSGVYVNGKKIISTELITGDKLGLGDCTLTVFFGELPVESSAVEMVIPTDTSELIQPEKDEKPISTAEQKVDQKLEQKVDAIFSGLQDADEVEDIFVHDPKPPLALEVVMSWKGTILNVAHFPRKATVTVGHSRKNSFMIPKILGTSCFPLIAEKKGKLYLNLDSPMSAVVQREGEVQKFNGKKGTQIPFDWTSFARVTLNDIDFYLGFTKSPPRLMRRRVFDRDPVFFKTMGTSLLFTALVVVALANIKVNRVQEIEELPPRIATILYQPEKYSLPIRPVISNSADRPAIHEKLPSDEAHPSVGLEERRGERSGKSKGMAPITSGKGVLSQRVGNEGAGPRAKGKAGSQGLPNAPLYGKLKQYEAKRPSPRGGSGPGGGGQGVKGGLGNLDVIKGAGTTIGNLLGSGMERLGGPGSDLRGFGGFDTRGSSGLALSGTGPGGGGEAESLGGLAKNGPGAGRVGTGAGAVGTGGNIIGGQTRLVPLREGIAEEVIIGNAISFEEVDAAIRRHKDEFTLCYEREINAGIPNLEGSVYTGFGIGAMGRVTRAGIRDSTIKNARTERCILQVLKRIQFPRPRGGGMVEIVYPFKFRPVSLKR